MREIKLPFLVRLSLVLIAVVIIGYLAKIGQTILAPLFFSLLMAFLFTPFAEFFEKKLRFKRGLSTLMSLFALMTLMLSVTYFFYTQLSAFVDDFPKLQQQIVKSAEDLQIWISKTFNVKINKQIDYINQALEKLVSSSAVILGFTLSMFSTIGGFLVFSFLFFIFILNYRGLLFDFIVNVFHEKHNDRVRTITKETQKIVKQYIIGLVIQVILVSIITSIFLSVTHVKYAILLGVLTGFLNVIPYVGVIISCIFAVIIAFATGGASPLIVALGYVGIHAIDANIILPLVVGSKVKINALFTFIGLLIGESLWGISGMFLSIPFLAILKIIFENVDELKPWGKLLGEPKKKSRKKYKLTKTIVLEEKE